MLYVELCLVKCVYKYADIDVGGRCMQPLNSSMQRLNARPWRLLSVDDTG